MSLLHGSIIQRHCRACFGNCDAAIASSLKAKEKLLAWGVPEDKIFVSLLTVDIEPYIMMHNQKMEVASEI